MKFDTVIIGGGLAGMVAGITLEKAGKKTAIISTGQNALHFFSGSFESLQEPEQRIVDLFSEAGVRLHYSPGVRLMPLGTFRESALALEDIDIFPSAQFARKVLIVNFLGYHDFFSSFLADGLEKQGMSCRVRFLNLPEMEKLEQSPSEMRSVQIARTMDRVWEKVVQEVRVLLKDEDTVVLPQVFGLQDMSVPGRIRQGIPARVVFAGTLPPSVPGLRTQILLKQRYQLLGGTYLMGDEVVRAHVHDGVVHSVATRNLDNHYIEGDNFILATGGYFSKGLVSNPFQVFEPVFGLDVEYNEDRNAWYNPAFKEDQPYMHFGVKADESLHALKDGQPVENLYVAGSVLGSNRPEFGTAAGKAVRTALKAADEILKV
ncbi:MAG TPA: anaerobic glycerol-3-phosphate dehydrogenase subunit B [Rikenellaceae bacterium]|nr:anaerobic glycerol-3-phosphate dehydrogenase subunit B [Bacteroidales bacterium]HAC40761.1 anaerobic glycerol-3-phosphate dehydrogenase subunit B [Rikenellaceae bacterium]